MIRTEKTQPWYEQNFVDSSLPCFIDAPLRFTFEAEKNQNSLSPTRSLCPRSPLAITLVPRLTLTKICKKSEKNLASVEIFRNLTNAN